MTREEAVDLLDNLIGMVDDNHDSDYDSALRMAIEALSAEPCDDATLKDIFCMGCEYKEQEFYEDAISRQAVLDELEKWDWQELYLPIHFKQILDDLPSVTPKQKMSENPTGSNSSEKPNKWIPVSEKLPEEYKEVIVTDVETSDAYLSRYIGNGYWECDNGSFKNRIIAWQPKPKPYKEEGEGAE